jgi:hypothetical protein
MTETISQRPPTLEELRARRDEILEIAARCGARNLRVFGSVARGDADGRSWNFLLAADRREALTRVRAQKPYLVIGSPPCTAFCQLNQRFNYKRMRPEKVQRRMVEGRVLLEFAAQVYRLQLAGGRHFVHEHPASASSWAEPCMQRLRCTPGVSEAVGDQCRFGLRSAGEHGALGPAKKPTRFLSSAGCVLRELGRQCLGDHTHVRLLGGRRAADAAEYPRGLCRALLRGISAQRQREGHDPLGLLAPVPRAPASTSWPATTRQAWHRLPVR